MGLMVRIVGLAACFYIAGEFGLLLAIPPGYATPFWPAAGIGVAGLLIFGFRVWPGVLLGAFLVNLGQISAIKPAEVSWSHITTVELSASIAVGATLQALLGAFLVKRFVGYPTSLAREKDVAVLLLSVGPVSCLVNATLGVGLLLGFMRIQPQEAAFTWWTWWAGDTIGAFVVTQVVLLWTMRPESDWPRRPLTLTIPLLALSAVVVGLFIYVDDREQARIRHAFEFQTESLTRALETRLDYATEALNGMRNFHGNRPNAADQTRFVRSAHAILARRATVQALTWAPRVRSGEREDFEQAGRNMGDSDFAIREHDDQGKFIIAKDRSEYFPILYREPPPNDSRAIGYDVSSEPSRREALLLGADSGEPKAPPPIVPTGNPGSQRTILIYMPVYRDDVVPSDKREAVIGYVVAVFRIGEIVNLAWKDSDSEGIECWIYDDTTPAEKHFAFYRSSNQDGNDKVPPPLPTAAPGRLQRQTTVDAAGRRWVMQFATTPEYLVKQRSAQAWAVLAGGMLVTGLLGAVLLVVTGRAAVVTELVQERTADLEESRRFTERIAQMMPSVLYVIDLKEHRTLFVSQRAESILGYSPEQMSQKGPSAFRTIAHPDDVAKFDWAAEQYQTAEDGATIEMEYRVRHANGEWRWMHARETIFGRDVDGNPTQVLGAALDVTDRKRLELEVLEVAATEQRRIGGELHDSVGQELTGLCMLVDNLGEGLRDESPDEAQRADRIAGGLRQALGEVRALSRGLIPVEVDSEGLMAALSDLASRTTEVHGIPCEFSCQSPVTVHNNFTATQLFRIAQEAMTNAVKHSKAANIRVSLERKGAFLTLKIADDGIGLPEDMEESGVGLRIMRYRAGQIGAQLSVRTAGGGGTLVSCMLYRGNSDD
jgi:PAS domain S-box-containing protein